MPIKMSICFRKQIAISVKAMIAFILASNTSSIGLAQPNGNSVSLQAELSNDLQFIKEKLTQNHPGMNNNKDPHFKDLVLSEYEKAYNLSKQVNSEDDYTNCLKTYTKSFEDPHLGILVNKDKNSPSLDKAENQIQDKYYLREIKPGITLIRLSTFSPQEKDIKELTYIKEQLPRHRQDEAIIFDLRGNGGGNSAWGEQILKSLFTENYYNWSINKANSKVVVDWKCSTDNLSKMTDTATQYKTMFGETSKEYQFASRISSGLTKAANSKKQYFREYRQHQIAKSPKPNNPVDAQIFVIINSKCFSATLDFIDDILALGPVNLVGQETGFDRDYMDCNMLDLPSGKAKLYYPMKVYRNRRRADKQKYIPNLSYAPIEDTQGLLNLIEEAINKNNCVTH
jgi:hypothetical protein